MTLDYNVSNGWLTDILGCDGQEGHIAAANNTLYSGRHCDAPSPTHSIHPHIQCTHKQPISAS